MTKQQMELLIELITDIAKEVYDDEHSHGSDYAGMGLHRIKQRAGELAEEFNKAI